MAPHNTCSAASSLQKESTSHTVSRWCQPTGQLGEKESLIFWAWGVILTRGSLVQSILIKDGLMKNLSSEEASLHSTNGPSASGSSSAVPTSCTSQHGVWFLRPTWVALQERPFQLARGFTNAAVYGSGVRHQTTELQKAKRPMNQTRIITNPSFPSPSRSSPVSDVRDLL